MKCSPKMMRYTGYLHILALAVAIYGTYHQVEPQLMIIRNPMSGECLIGPVSGAAAAVCARLSCERPAS